MEQREEGVHVLQGADALVQDTHDCRGVLSQFQALGLFIPALQLPELVEEI